MSVAVCFASAELSARRRCACAASRRGPSSSSAPLSIDSVMRCRTTPSFAVMPESPPPIGFDALFVHRAPARRSPGPSRPPRRAPTPPRRGSSPARRRSSPRTSSADRSRAPRGRRRRQYTAAARARARPPPAASVHRDDEDRARRRRDHRAALFEHEHHAIESDREPDAGRAGTAERLDQSVVAAAAAERALRPERLSCTSNAVRV